jgi:hypothetical protein
LRTDSDIRQGRIHRKLGVTKCAFLMAACVLGWVIHSRKLVTMILAKKIILALFATISVLAMVLYLIWTWVGYAMQTSASRPPVIDCCLARRSTGAPLGGAASGADRNA